MKGLQRLAIVTALAIGAVIPMQAGSVASAVPPTISCEPSGLGLTCTVVETVPGVGTSKIICEVIAADTSQLPARLGFSSGTCTVELTSALLGTKITLSCSGEAGFLETDPTTLQIGDGSCQGNVKLLGITIGQITTTGQLSTITITGSAVTYQAGGAQFAVSLPGTGVGLDCNISGSIVLDPNAVIPILVHPPIPDC